LQSVTVDCVASQCGCVHRRPDWDRPGRKLHSCSFSCGWPCEAQWSFYVPPSFTV